MMNRRGRVFVKNVFAGVLKETEAGEYVFQYDSDYLKSSRPEVVSLTLPLNEEVYRSDELFSFFDGLIPEGWLLNLAAKNWKIDQSDRMGLLLTCCRECIGAVHILPELLDKEVGNE